MTRASQGCSSLTKQVSQLPSLSETTKANRSLWRDSLTMGAQLELTDARNKLEDLSGIELQPGENPYTALIRTCNGNPVSHAQFHQKALTHTRLTPRPGRDPDPLLRPPDKEKRPAGRKVPGRRLQGAHRRPVPPEARGPDRRAGLPRPEELPRLLGEAA